MPPSQNSTGGKTPLRREAKKGGPAMRKQCSVWDTNGSFWDTEKGNSVIISVH